MIYNERILCAMGKSAPKNSSLRRPKVTLRSAKRKFRSFSPLDICSMLRVIGWRLNVNKNSEPKVLATCCYVKAFPAPVRVLDEAEKAKKFSIYYSI